MLKRRALCALLASSLIAPVQAAPLMGDAAQLIGTLMTIGAAGSAGKAQAKRTPAAAAPTAASQQFTQCPQFFVAGKAPAVPDLAAKKARALCFDAFAVLHSGVTKTPIYVAERLSREQLLDAKDEARTNRFFADARLPSAERAQLEDYKGSGYDRGHLAPAGDMPTAQAMAQSFSLANMQPQAPENNRGVWADIEKATRKYVMRASGDVYVITGGLFSSTPTTIGPGRVAVPDAIWKLVYDPSKQRAWAHWVPNTNEAKAGPPISYSELVKRTGVNWLPDIPH